MIRIADLRDATVASSCAGHLCHAHNLLDTCVVYKHQSRVITFEQPRDAILGSQSGSTCPKRKSCGENPAIGDNQLRTSSKKHWPAKMTPALSFLLEGSVVETEKLPCLDGHIFGTIVQEPNAKVALHDQYFQLVGKRWCTFGSEPQWFAIMGVIHIILYA